MGSSKKDKYVFTLGASLNTSNFSSQLFNEEETRSQNAFNYQKRNIYTTGVYTFNRKAWSVAPSYSVRVLRQDLEQQLSNEKQEESNLLFEPALNLKYKLNPNSFVLMNLGFSQNTNAPQFFFLNEILVSNRATISNVPSIELQKSQIYSLLYFNNDLTNQFELSINMTYQKTTGNFFTNQDIAETSTRIQYFFLPQDNDSWNFNSKIAKYIPFLESTIKLKTNYSINNFRNIVNNSQLRQNQNQFVRNSVFWKTAFSGPIDFENTFTYDVLISDSQEQITFTNRSWQNTFKVIFKPSKKWFLILSTDYFLPDTDRADQHFFFFDATLRHKPKSKKWAASFIMRNITNESNFEQIQTSDVSTSVYRTNLLPRYAMLSFSWNF